MILAVAAVFGLAAAVQSVTGFGFALVAVPLLALVLGPAPAVVATTLVSLLVSVAVLEGRPLVRSTGATPGWSRWPAWPPCRWACGC